MLKLRIGVVIAVLLCLGIIIFFASKRIEAALAGEMQKTLEDVATQNIIAVNKEVAAKYKNEPTAYPRVLDSNNESKDSERVSV